MTYAGRSEFTVYKEIRETPLSVEMQEEREAAAKWFGRENVTNRHERRKMKKLKINV